MITRMTIVDDGQVRIWTGEASSAEVLAFEAKALRAEADGLIESWEIEQDQELFRAEIRGALQALDDLLSIAGDPEI